MAHLPAVAEVAVAEDEAGEGIEYIHTEGPVEEEQELGDPQVGVVGRLRVGGCVGVGGSKIKRMDQTDAQAYPSLYYVYW